MNIDFMGCDIRAVLARKYAAYLSPKDHQSLFRNMPLAVAYECLADANRLLKKHRAIYIRTHQPSGSYLVPRLRFRGPRSGKRWQHGRQAYCLKTEANRASLYFYEKVYC